MTRQEFAELVQIDISEVPDGCDWQIIQRVYNYHPIISNMCGRSEIADIYYKGGMGLIRELNWTALKVEEIETAIVNLRVAIEQREEELMHIRDEFRRTA